MRNLFENERDDEKFVVATKDAELREKRIAELSVVRRMTNKVLVIQLIFVTAVFALSVFNDESIVARNGWFWAIVVSMSLANALYVDLQIKFLKAARD